MPTGQGTELVGISGWAARAPRECERGSRLSAPWSSLVPITAGSGSHSHHLRRWSAVCGQAPSLWTLRPSRAETARGPSLIGDRQTPRDDHRSHELGEHRAVSGFSNHPVRGGRCSNWCTLPREFSSQSGSTGRSWRRRIKQLRKD